MWRRSLSEQAELARNVIRFPEGVTRMADCVTGLFWCKVLTEGCQLLSPYVLKRCNTSQAQERSARNMKLSAAFSPRCAHRARHERACRRAGGARSTRHAQAGRRHLRPARRAAPPGRHSARLSAGGREGREGGESGEGRVRARKGDPRANDDRSCDRPGPTRP